MDGALEPLEPLENLSALGLCRCTWALLNGGRLARCNPKSLSVVNVADLETRKYRIAGRDTDRSVFGKLYDGPTLGPDLAEAAR